MRDKYPQIIAVLKGTDYKIFGLGLATLVLAVTIASLRLKLIIGAQGDIPVRLPEAVALTFIGYFFNNFLPTAIGGDVIKAYYLSKKTSDKMGSYTAVFVDRAIGLFTMIFMGFLALLLVGANVIDESVRRMLYVITAISVLAVVFILNKNFARIFSVLLLFFKPIEERLKRAYGTVNKYRHNLPIIFKSLIISVMSQILFFISIGILASSIDSRISTMDILLRMPIISAMSLLPSINGLGVREGSTVLLFGPLIGKENAFAVSILWLLALLLISFIGGVIYAVSPQFKVKLNQIA